MLEFKKFEIADIEIIKKYTDLSGENSCETAFANLYVWQDIYNNRWAEKDGQLIIKSGKVYRLPLGNDFLKGIELIREDSGKEFPTFWAEKGELLDKFKADFGDKYDFFESRDDFDYIYLSSDLAELSGKKYHSKRNHISAFSKKYEWEFKALNDNTAKDIIACAEAWYKEKVESYDKDLSAEIKGLKKLIDNSEKIGIMGGAIYVDGKVIAFALGSEINNETFDIHMEKCLKDYAEGYAVINREFAKTLTGYKYINREDDMGIEGLRKAKLSYKPHILLEKYVCREKQS